MAGASLVTLAGVLWLFVLPVNIRGRVGNPYIGLLLFIAIPAVFFLGLALIPIGIALARRRRRVPADFNWRRTGIFFAAMTLVNILVGSQLSYRAVEHLETVQFCGQSCHVMKPEFTAHQLPPHQSVSCASCHIAPGADGWLKAKMSGTRQLGAVVFNSFPRPIESAMESNRLISSADTCEQCHARDKPSGPRLRVFSKFQEDEANTRTETVLTMQVGRIHGAHMGPGVRIRYTATDKKRQTISWVEYRNTGGVTRTYVAGDAKANLPIFEMQCVDCHNRAAHAFQLPERAMDEAMARGEIPVGLPFVKKNGIELLKASYATDDEAERKIPAGLSAFYKGKPDVQATGQALLAIYRHNVFPDLKVTWGTYPNNLGHSDNPGCFRCHDDSHATADKKTISQDCNACHQAVAVEEKSPDVLKTLGITQ